MEEKRKFFRIRNQGDMFAKTVHGPLEVIDMSAASAAVKSDYQLPQQGTLELKISGLMLLVDYEILKVSGQHLVLAFNNEEQIELLLPVLKTLRNQRKQEQAK